MKPMSCFVIMPFSKEYTEVYKSHIKPLIEEQFDDIDCVRMDEQMRLGSIHNNILDEIDRCSFVIADVSNENRNVFFEVGYAYGKGKTIIFIYDGDVRNLPVDINNLFVIEYDKNIGYKGLQATLKKVIEVNIKESKHTQNIIETSDDAICGCWTKTYQRNNKKYKVCLSIYKERVGSKYVYAINSEISIDNQFHIFQPLKYNGVLNKKSNNAELWVQGNWIEFVGSSWTNLYNSRLSSYLLNAFAINTILDKGDLIVRIWDNASQNKITYRFKRRIRN